MCCTGGEQQIKNECGVHVASLADSTVSVAENAQHEPQPALSKGRDLIKSGKIAVETHCFSQTNGS